MVGMSGVGGFGGISSGLDTHEIISQMLQASARPMQRLEQQKANEQRTDEAWSTVASKLASAREDAESLHGQAAFDGFVSASSTNEDLVTASAHGPAADGELTFTVESLASNHQVFGGAFAERDAVLDGGELTLEFADGAQQSVTVDAGTTLEGLAAQITDDASVDASARVVEREPGEFTLLLEGVEQGEAARFAVTTDVAGFGTGFATAREAADAVLSVGDMEVRRTTNEIDDLLDDTTLELHRASPGQEVTVSAGRDLDAAVESATGMVDGIAQTLGELGGLMQVDQVDDERTSSGPLQGDPTARQIVSQLRRALSEPRELDGEQVLPSEFGIEVDRYGDVTVDEEAVREAFAADFDRAAAFFGGDGEATDDSEGVAGLAGALLGRLDGFEGSGGAVERARDAIERRIDQFDDRLERHEQRLADREQTLRADFTRMETQLAELQQMQARMQQAMGGAGGMAAL